MNLNYSSIQNNELGLTAIRSALSTTLGINVNDVKIISIRQENFIQQNSRRKLSSAAKIQQIRKLITTVIGVVIDYRLTFASQDLGYDSGESSHVAIKTLLSSPYSSYAFMTNLQSSLEACGNCLVIPSGIGISNNYLISNFTVRDIDNIQFLRTASPTSSPQSSTSQIEITSALYLGMKLELVIVIFGLVSIVLVLICLLWFRTYRYAAKQPQKHQYEQENDVAELTSIYPHLDVGIIPTFASPINSQEKSFQKGPVKTQVKVRRVEDIGNDRESGVDKKERDVRSFMQFFNPPRRKDPSSTKKLNDWVMEFSEVEQRFVWKKKVRNLHRNNDLYSPIANIKAKTSASPSPRFELNSDFSRRPLDTSINMRYNGNRIVTGINSTPVQKASSRQMASPATGRTTSSNRRSPTINSSVNNLVASSPDKISRIELL